MDVVLLFIPLASSLLLSISLIQWFKIKASWAPFAALCVIQIWVYVFALFDVLYIGALSATVASVLFFIFTLIRAPKKSDLFRALLDPGMIYFIVLTVLTVINYHLANQSFIGSDEISFWGQSYKITFVNQSLYPHSDFKYSAFSYPPLSQITWYAFTYLSPMIHEWYVKALACMCIYAGAATIFSNIRDNRWYVKVIKIAASVFIAYYLPLTHKSFGAYEFIYADAFMAAWLTAILVIYFSTREVTRAKLVMVVLGFITLTLIKDTGMLFSACAAGMIGLDLLYVWWRRRPKREHKLGEADRKVYGLKKSRHYVIFLAVMIVCIFAARVSWNVYLAQNAIPSFFTNFIAIVFKPAPSTPAAYAAPNLKIQIAPVAASQPAASVEGTDDENPAPAAKPSAAKAAPVPDRTDVGYWLNQYIAKLFKYNTGIGIVPLITLIILLVLAVFAVFAPRGLERRRKIILVFSTLIAVFIYFACLFVVYVMVFPMAQLSYFAGIQRYDAPFSLALIGLVTAIALSTNEKPMIPEVPEARKRSAKPVLEHIFKALVLAFLLFIVYRYAPQQINPITVRPIAPDAKRAIARVELQAFSSRMTPHKDKIFVIAQDDLPNKYTRLISSGAAYEYYPIVVVNPGSNFAFDLPQNNDPSKHNIGDFYDIATYTKYVDLDGMKAYIASTGATYVIVYRTNPSFLQDFGPAFSDGAAGATEKTPHLYKIVSGSGGVRFELIE